MGEKEEEGGPEVDVADVPLRLRGRQRLTHVPSWRVHMAVSSRSGATAGFGWLVGSLVLVGSSVHGWRWVRVAVGWAWVDSQFFETAPHHFRDQRFSLTGGVCIWERPPPRAVARRGYL